MPYSMPGKKRALGGGGSAPAAPGAATGASAGGAAPSAKPAAAAPGYVNFSRLLAVNQGGAQRMADTLVSGAQQKGQAAQKQIDDAKAGFNAKVEAGTQKYAAPTTPGATSGDIYTQAGALSAKAKQGYAGPKDWSGAGYDTVKLAGTAKEASEAAKGLTTAGGRGAALRAQAGGPYSAGMSALDSGLSGAALGNRGQELVALYGGLSQRLIDYQKEGGAAVDAATAASNEAMAKYGADAEAYQRLGDTAKQNEEDAAAYQEAYWRRYPGLRPGARAPSPVGPPSNTFNPRLLTPGLYG